MARLQLDHIDGGAKHFYEGALNIGDEDDGLCPPQELKSLKSDRRSRGDRQRSSPSQTMPDGSRRRTVRRKRSGKFQMDSILGQMKELDVQAHIDMSNTQDRSSPLPSDSHSEEREEDGSTASSDSSDKESQSSSDGGSDLDGLNTASAMEEAAVTQRKHRGKGSSQAITEEGVACKLGVAFSRVLERGSKQRVMQGSKSVQKRRREEEEEVAHTQLLKQQRRERRRLGYVKVLPKGKDPEQDAIEKTLVSVATKGVVQLFNAISKAQTARRHASASGDKSKDVVKSTKAALLGVLKPESAPQQESKPPGWKVLQEGFTGLQQAARLKDYDKERSDEELSAEEIEDQENDTDDIDQW